MRAWLDSFLFSSSAKTQQLGFRRIERNFSDLNGLLNNSHSCRTRQCAFCHLSSKQRLEMEAVVLHRVAFLEYFCPKQGQDFKPLAAPLYPNVGQVSPRGKNQTQFKTRLLKPYPSYWTKMAKFDILFMTKTAEKPYPLGPYTPI